VDCQFSDGIDDIGRIRWQKLWRLLRYCLEAIWCRFRYGVTTFFYIPAPPMMSAIGRDWLVMALCRPFFPRRIYYWQAAGLGEWLTSRARPWQRRLTRALLGKPDLSIVMGEYCRTEGVALDSRLTVVVPNGVPDPCPEFAQTILPARIAQATVRRRLFSEEQSQGPASPAFFRVLFLSLCTREKGLFDSLEAVALANEELRQKRSPLRVQLTVAGKFWREADRQEFDKRIQRPDLMGRTGEPLVRYCGFVAEADKKRLFVESDCFCFPTYYEAESFGIVLVEAMAFGLPIITTRWRTIPELLPAGYDGIVPPKSPERIAPVMLEYLQREYDSGLRAWFLDHFTERQYADKMVTALESVDAPNNEPGDGKGDASTP
jgi:glycosyltransferase involved in cell wall biosynthesis